MNNKQTILKILDKHRDMSLTAGCEVSIHYEADGFPNEGSLEFSPEMNVRGFVVNKPHLSCDGDNYDDFAVKDIKDGHNEDYDCTFTILGHPATPLTLLKALMPNNNFSIDGMGRLFEQTAHNPTDHKQVTKEFICTIPDVTTLTEIHHTQPLWTDLLPILS